MMIKEFFRYCYWFIFLIFPFWSCWLQVFGIILLVVFLLIVWIVKTMVELPFFYSIATFFNKQWAVKWFFFFQPLHIFYTIISGLFGQFGKYEWKGRRVK